MKVSYFWKLNIGYIFFDGVEIKYILIDELEFVEGSFWSGIFESLIYVLEFFFYLNLSFDDLIMRDFFKDMILWIFLILYKRLLVYVYFFIM